jgi:LmbE family N-acetylglucosaminyl deacetylase
MSCSATGIRGCVVVALIALAMSGRATLWAQEAEVPARRPLKIVAFGAHPDDCEIQAGGAAALWSDRGDQVRFVSATNGDIGHWQLAGGALARRRFDEVQRAAKLLGTTTVVLDNHDGELLPTLENRREFTRQIRTAEADIVLSHRPNDYHPDHRYTGVLVQDSAYMVSVPFFCPDVKPLQENPVFLYYHDRFQKPNPFKPDIVLSIDAVVERKLAALGVMESQFLEGGALGHPGLMPKDDADHKRRQAEVRSGFMKRFEGIANQYRDKLIELYGEEQGSKVHYAEAFELCEYGRQPGPEELRRLFPVDENAKAATAVGSQPAARLNVTGPQNRSVGEIAEFVVDVVNVTETSLGGLKLSIDYDGALFNLESATKGIPATGVLEWNLPAVEQGQTQRFRARCRCVSAGKACIVATVTYSHGFKQAQEWCVDIAEPAADLKSVTEPIIRQ